MSGGILIISSLDKGFATACMLGDCLAQLDGYSVNWIISILGRQWEFNQFQKPPPADSEISITKECP